MRRKDGMVSTPSEKDREAARVLLGPCSCHPAYRVRGKRDPSCVACDYGDEAALVIATARSEGYRAGLERAAKWCEAGMDLTSAASIRALADAGEDA